MRPTEEHPDLARSVRTLRIIVLAIFAGLALWLGVGAWRHLGPIAHEVPEQASFLTWVAVALGLTQPLVFWIVRWALSRQALEVWNHDDIGPFRARYTAAVLVGAAGTEAGGLLVGLAYFLEGRDIALAAGAWCALFVLFALPSRRGVDHLIGSRPYGNVGPRERGRGRARARHEDASDIG